MGFIERLRDFVGLPQTDAPSNLLKPRGEFMRAGRGVVFGGWRPALRDASDDVGKAWTDAAARAIDTIHNSGWIAGAIDQAVANTVGTGLRLKCAPESEQLGMSDADARKWARTVEQRFGSWALGRSAGHTAPRSAFCRLIASR
jgi:Phage portal protein, lambda family